MKLILPILSLAVIPGLLSAEAVDSNKGVDINPGFTPKLYAQLSETENNVFFSPYSITEAMAMVHAGAGGNTADEIAKALSIHAKADAIAPRLMAQRALISAHANKGDNKLNIANALCITGKVPEQNYQDIVRNQFKGEIFAGGLEKINGWVEKKTEGNIKKILDELDPNSACVLLNAVYFKGNWQTPFKPSATYKAPFHLDNGKDVKVDMMSRTGSFRVLRDNGLLALELPYKTSASMVLIQADKADGMAALEKQFNEGLLLDLGQRLATAPMERARLFLPKFKIQTKYDLMQPMAELGIKDAFSFKNSDFKKMYARSAVKISQIRHKATLEVDEQGSVATAATAVEMTLKSAAKPRPTPQIRFDRPFMVLIREGTTGTNLFVGRINDPTK